MICDGCGEIADEINVVRWAWPVHGTFTFRTCPTCTERATSNGATIL